MPTTELSDDNFADGKIGIIELLIKAGFASSRGEGRRLIEQGGVSIDNEKITDLCKSFEKSSFTDGMIIKKGKKSYHRFTIQ